MSLVEMTGSLPMVGGLFDQDPYWIERIKLWNRVKAQKQELEQAKLDKRNKPKRPGKVKK